MEMGDSPSRWQRVKNLWAAEKYFFLSNLAILAVTTAAGGVVGLFCAVALAFADLVPSHQPCAQYRRACGGRQQR